MAAAGGGDVGQPGKREVRVDAQFAVAEGALAGGEVAL